jgi:hypothetical protein
MRFLEESRVEREQTICPSPYPVSVGGEMRLFRGLRLAVSLSRGTFRGRLKAGHVFSKQSLRAALLLRKRERRLSPELDSSLTRLISESVLSLVSAAMFAPRKNQTPNQSPEPTTGLRPVVAHL